MIDLEEIKDIFIHFEEKNYKVEVSGPRYRCLKIIDGDTSGDSPVSVHDNIDFLKNVKSNGKVLVSELYVAKLTGNKSIVNFKEWSEIQADLSTCIKRLGYYNFRISEYLTVGKIELLLSSPPFLKLKNLGEFNQIVKDVNRLNVGRIDYSLSGDNFKIRFYKMSSDKTIDYYRNILEKNFFIKDITKDGKIINRKGEVSKDQHSGYIFELEPKIDININ